MESRTSLVSWVMPRLAVIHGLAEILGEVAAATPDLAIASPPRQRLALTRWIARARALEGAIAPQHWLTDGTEHVRRALRHLARLWWPGSVLALAVGTKPCRAFGKRHPELCSWAAVVRRCDILLTEVAGWADDHAQDPRPFAAGERFAALAARLEALGGPLGCGGALDAGSPLLDAARAQLIELRTIAAELRWLRGIVDPVAWGAAIGRVRGLARGLGDEELSQLLDPAFAPESGWARHLGVDPEVERICAAVPDVLADDPTIASWLIEAIEAGLETSMIVGVASHLQSRIGALSADLGHRRLRRRLRKLQASMLPASIEALPEEDASEPEAKGEAVPHLREVGALVDGMKAAFVTNRSAPDVADALMKKLGLRCEIIIHKTRQRQALLQRIRARTFDLVLVAHGFSGHNDTEAVKGACRSAGVPYIAVEKGRFAKIVLRIFESRHLFDVVEEDSSTHAASERP